MTFSFTKNQTKSDLSRVSTKLKLRLTNFKHQHFISVGNVVATIDRLPAFHLEHLKEITFDSDRSILKHIAKTDRNTQTHAIGIYVHRYRTIAIFDTRDKELFTHTLLHEIGHHVYFCVIGQRLKNLWVTAVCRRDSFVSIYASLNAAEDFAESYASYLLKPNELETIPLKYNFLKNYVFEGYEKTPHPEKLNLLI